MTAPSSARITALLLTGLMFSAFLVPTFAEGTVQALQQRILDHEVTGDTFLNSPVNGTYYWWLAIHNGENQAVGPASIQLTTPYASDACSWSAEPNSTEPAGDNYKYSWSLGEPLGVAQPNRDTGVYFGCPTSATFEPAFDAYRKVTPRMINSQFTNETVTIGVTPRTSLSGLSVWVNVGSDEFALLVPKSPIPLNPSHMHPDQRYVEWFLDNPSKDSSYQFNVTLQVTNPRYPAMVFYEPTIGVAAVKQPDEQINYSGTSVTISDNMLGSITYSTSGNHNWIYNEENRYQVTFQSNLGTPTVSVLINSPQAMSVVSRLVNVTATVSASAGSISFVQFRVDEGGWSTMNLVSSASGSNASITWDTGNFSNGFHEITIRAEDSNGIFQNSTLNVVVDNSGPRFVGYSQLTQFFEIVIAVIAIVGAAWLKDRRRKQSAELARK